MFANTQHGGRDHAFPDVCSAPGAEPSAHVSVADGALGIPASCDVLFAGAPAHNLSTVIVLSSGEHPAGCAGSASRTRHGKSRHTSGVDSVLVAGMPATRLGSQTSQNAGNAQGARLSPSQTKVLLLGR